LAGFGILTSLTSENGGRFEKEQNRFLAGFGKLNGLISEKVRTAILKMSKTSFCQVPVCLPRYLVIGKSAVSKISEAGSFDRVILI
jgi:hypothetical protein